MAITLDMTAIYALSGKQLAERIGCKTPDSDDSAGAVLLEYVRDRTLDNVEEVLAEDYEPREVIEGDRLGMIESNAIPDGIDPDKLWRQFTDLGAWQDFWQDFNVDYLINLAEELRYKSSEFGSKDMPTMTQFARSAVLMIVNNLIHNLVEKLQEQYEEIEPQEDEDEE